MSTQQQQVSFPATSNGQPVTVTFSVKPTVVPTPDPSVRPIKYIGHFFRPPTSAPNQQRIADICRPYSLAKDFVISYVSSNLEYLNQVNGQKTRGLNSFAAMQAGIATYKQQGFTAIGYDLETGHDPEDLANIPAAMKKAHDLCKLHGMKLVAIPGPPANGVEYIRAVTDNCDVLIIQCVAQESNKQTFINFVTQRVIEARKSLNKIPILIEPSVGHSFATAPYVADLYNAVNAITPLDGFHLWYGQPSPNPTTEADLDRLEEFYRLLMPDAPYVDGGGS